MSVQTLTPVIESIEINGRYQSLKRCCDIVFTLLIAVPLVLVCVVIALLIKLDSRGPVFYRQRRIGMHGESFDMLKFRSMYTNADDAVHRSAIELYMAGQALNGTGALSFKKVDDPRITRVGRVIRKLSLDELPQFINVLRGEMSLVGPRPPIPYEYERYSEQDALRLCGKPGLTGPWQVYGRSRVPFHVMVEMDIAYLRRQSLWEDCKLVILTIPVMLFARGGA